MTVMDAAITKSERGKQKPLAYRRRLATDREQDFQSATAGGRHLGMDDLAADSQKTIQTKHKLDCPTRLARVGLIPRNS